MTSKPNYFYGTFAWKGEAAKKMATVGCPFYAGQVNEREYAAFPNWPDKECG